MMKLERIIAEIEKTKDTISKQQAKLRELEAQKTEVENLQIVQMVRALRMTPAELSTFLCRKSFACVCHQYCSEALGKSPFFTSSI